MGCRHITAAALASAALTAAVLGLASCGGGGPSDDEFRAAAGKICMGATPSLDSIQRFASVNPGSRRFAEHAAVISQKVELMRDDLSKLDVPDNLSADFDEFDGHLGEMQNFWNELSMLTQTKGRIAANLNALRISKAYVDARKLGIDPCVDASHALAQQVDQAG